MVFVYVQRLKPNHNKVLSLKTIYPGTHKLGLPYAKMVIKIVQFINYNDHTPLNCNRWRFMLKSKELSSHLLVNYNSQYIMRAVDLQDIV